MSLKDLSIKQCYDSDSDDILNYFYIPALSASIKYQRLAGFFSSTSLAIAAKGIAGLIANNGKMQLICGAKLKREDVAAIVEASKSPAEIIETCALQDLENIENLQNEFIINHVKALGWMVANQLLEIKVAIVRDENGNPLDYSQIEEAGIFHQKVGVLYDADGNIISFSGSDNETASAWTNNIEEFKVFCSWDEYQKDYMRADCGRFYKFWNGLARRTDVFEVPKAVKNKLIELAPENIEQLKLGKKKKGVRLWTHQTEAIDKWLENDRRCIFEMATGTGKTFAALGCLKKLMADEKKLVTVIACPFNHLISQWQGDLDEFDIRIDSMIADSSNPKWKHQLANNMRDINNDVFDNLVIFTTHDTFYTSDFVNILKIFRDKVFLIADEVHGIGSEERKKGLLEGYDFRLGLSATPSRWFDPEGTADLLSYFNIDEPDDAFVFPLEKAIKTINPATGETYLCPYDYRPYFLQLTEDELGEYVEQTRNIAKAYYASKDREERNRNFGLLCIKRQEIIRNAQSKYSVFENILDDIGELSHCLIYCSPEQIEIVQNILNERKIIQHKFTQQEGTRPDLRYGEMSERDFLLMNFVDGSYQALVAMRCLDEGVDIPKAKIGIILASTGNPRQYIQRRGRLLRRFPGKEKAFIYDLIVLPSLRSGLPQELIEIERKILAKELSRYEEFAGISDNVVECIRKILDVQEELRTMKQFTESNERMI